MGKTHLAVAFALKSIENGYGAYFVRAYDMMEHLRKSRAEGRLDRCMRVYLAPKVLIVDEFGIWSYYRESATALFSLVSGRYERGSIILTSNKGFADWGEILGDAVIATVILDRLLTSTADETRMDRIAEHLAGHYRCATTRPRTF